MRVYKVLDKGFGGLTSLGVNGEHMLTYPTDKPIVAPSMFVYGTLEEAMHGQGVLYHSLAIWECETISTRPAPPLILDLTVVNPLFGLFWQTPDGPDPQWLEANRHWLMHTPPGSLLVDYLRLIEEVSDPKRSSTGRVKI